MKPLKRNFLLIALITIAFNSFSQEEKLLNTVPTSPEGFKSSEARFINTVNWLENTPLEKDDDKRKKESALVLAWITNSPTVTIEVHSNIINSFDKNGDLLLVYMGGWAKYSLENSYSEDKIKGNLAGIRSAIKLYKLGGDIKKDKLMEKLISLDEKNELEGWIKEQLAM